MSGSFFLISQGIYTTNIIRSLDKEIILDNTIRHFSIKYLIYLLFDIIQGSFNKLSLLMLKTIINITKSFAYLHN